MRNSTALTLLLLFLFSCSPYQTNEDAFKYENYFKLVKKSDYSEVQKHLENGTDTELRDYAGECAIHWAAINDDLQMIQLLKSFGADINSWNAYGETALLLLIKFHGTIDTIKYIIENGSDINHQDNNGYSALHYATFPGDMEKVSLLISKGAYVNAADKHGNTPLHYAAKSGRGLKIIKLLLGNGADKNLPGEWYETPLRMAKIVGDIESIEYLESIGARDSGMVPIPVHKIISRIIIMN
ncbi:MAG TPA: ankyrin repeat domain-containing protein [Spirochaetota bacterium]|nr:ankyrin repeat domain-containing protein [Spirochaetota bacterium]HPF06133.1 ankyrin repeat domain-containing protein [Spirochaetota bacterium]HRX47146.1 ankyrin repeat domain-containing protein [Spirochaetota bacterium]